MRDRYPRECGRFSREDLTVAVIEAHLPGRNDLFRPFRFVIESEDEAGLHRYYLQGYMTHAEAMAITVIVPPATRHLHKVQANLKSQEVWFEKDQAVSLGRDFDVRWFLEVYSSAGSSYVAVKDRFWLDRFHELNPLTFDPKENDRADPRRRAGIRFDTVSFRCPRTDYRVERDPEDKPEDFAVQEAFPGDYRFRT